jgi:hypothetical protein
MEVLRNHYFPFHIFVQIFNHADDFLGNDYNILGLSFFGAI